MNDIDIMINELCYSYSCEIKRMLESNCTKDDLSLIFLESIEKIEHLKIKDNKFNEYIEKINECKPDNTKIIDQTLWVIFKNNIKNCIEYNQANLIIEIIDEIYNDSFSEIYNEVYDEAYSRAYEKASEPIRKRIQYEIDNDILKLEVIDSAIRQYRKDIYNLLLPRVTCEYINSVNTILYPQANEDSKDLKYKIQKSAVENIKLLLKNKKIRKNLINKIYKEIVNNLKKEDFDWKYSKISKSTIKKLSKFSHLKFKS